MNHKLEALASMLDSVRWQRDRHAFRARCPAHGGGADTLSVRIHPAKDQLQLTCFAGCGALAVLGVLALDWSALYPDRPADHRIRHAPPLPYREALLGIDNEAAVVAIIAGRLERGHALTAADIERMALAAQRIDAARRIARAAI